MFHTLSIQIMQFVSLPEQSSPNRPLEHWQLPLIPQIPWPLHVELGLQNANTNIKSVNLLVSKFEQIEICINYLNNQLRRIDCHNHKYHHLCRFHDHYNWLQLHMQLSFVKKSRSCYEFVLFAQLNPGGGGLVASLFLSFKIAKIHHVLIFLFFFRP